jgi:hypothetical protein
MGSDGTDGRKILYYGTEGGQVGFYAMNADGTGRTFLLPWQSPRFASRPRTSLWSASSTRTASRRRRLAPTLDVKNSPADVAITFALKDVRNKLDLTDYTGELRVTENWRLTDKNNGSISGGGGTDPATNSDIPFTPIDVMCAAAARA